MNFTHLFAQGPLQSIDMVHPETGLGVYSKETLEQIKVRYPGAEIYEFSSWMRAKEDALTTEAAEITEDKFIEMLEVLPPQNWQRGTGCESFELCEHTSGNITSIYCRFGQKYYAFTARARQTLAAHLAHCAKTFPELAVITTKPERLFVGVYPEGLVYADRQIEQAGDYKRLGFLSYRTLELQLEKGCPPELELYIRADAEAMRAKRGQPFQISSCGQTVTLGK